MLCFALTLRVLSPLGFFAHSSDGLWYSMCSCFLVLILPCRFASFLLSTIRDVFTQCLPVSPYTDASLRAWFFSFRTQFVVFLLRGARQCFIGGACYFFSLLMCFLALLGYVYDRLCQCFYFRCRSLFLRFYVGWTDAIVWKFKPTMLLFAFHQLLRMQLSSNG